MNPLVSRTKNTDQRKVRLLILKVLSLSAFAIGVAVQPLTMILVGVFAPSLVHSTAIGKLDPISDSLFWATVFLPPLGALLWMAYAAGNGKLDKDGEPRVGVMAMKILLGIVVAVILIPVGFLWAFELPALIRG